MSSRAAVPNEQIESALQWRYATKKYDATRKISPTDWNTLKQSLVHAPSSYGLQPLRYLVIETPDLRAKLREVSWGQTIITDASKLVVILSKEKVNETDVEHYIERIATVRKIPKESLAGYRDMMVQNVAKGMTPEISADWTRRQAYIALGFLIETAALLKIDATPIEGFDPAAYNKLLGLEGSGWRTAVIATLGYRHADDATQSYKKVRFEHSELIETR